MSNLSPKKLVIFAIILVIAGLHIFGPARQVTGFWHDLYSSYFSDLTMPFGFYFLLCASETNLPFLRPWWLKAGLVFGAASSAEILQFFGIYALGVTFDPLDLGMYAAGTLLAVALERGFFSRRFRFWQTG
jgi:hypothetical protein